MQSMSLGALSAAEAVKNQKKNFWEKLRFSFFLAFVVSFN